MPEPGPITREMMDRYTAWVASLPAPERPPTAEELAEAWEDAQSEPDD